jgi:hypothetical protein
MRGMADFGWESSKTSENKGPGRNGGGPDHGKVS